MSRYNGQPSTDNFPLESSHLVSAGNAFRYLAGERPSRPRRYWCLERRIKALAIAVVIRILQRMLDELNQKAEVTK